MGSTIDSLKKLAWRFACAKKGSDAEHETYLALKARFELILRSSNRSDASPSQDDVPRDDEQTG